MEKSGQDQTDPPQDGGNNSDDGYDVEGSKRKEPVVEEQD